MKNILQIMDIAAPYRGNFIPSIEALEEHWWDKGKMAFLFPEAARNVPWMAEFAATRKVYFIDRGFFSRKMRWGLLRRFNKIIKKEEIDVIHTHFVSYNYSLILWRMFCGRKIRIVGHFHGEFGFKGNPLMIRVKNRVVNHLYDTIIGCSEYVAETVRKNGISRPKIVGIPNAIRFDRLENYDKDYRFPAGYDKVVMMFGWTFYVKGVDRAIRAIQKVREAGMNVLLAIGYSAKAEELVDIIKQDVGYMPDFITILSPRDDVATYYQHADIFLSASRTEGFSYALLEATVCKPLPIVSDIEPSTSTNIPNLKVFEGDNIDDQAKKIIELLELSKEERSEIKMEQQKFVTTMYDLDRWAENVIEYYEIINYNNNI